MLTIADYSEFQGAVRPPAGQVVIIRAHIGWRPDLDFAANRAAAHTAGCAAVGLYQYLPAAVDPAGAARALLQLVGRLAGNEWLICDLEEGAGSQQGRWQTWRQTIIAATGHRPWLYSGLAFAQAHGLQPDWVAAYQPAEPTTPHKLWQNTSTYPWPWGRSDASVFDGTLPEFLAAAGIALPQQPTPPPPTPASLPVPLKEHTVHAVIDPAGRLVIVGAAADNGDLLVITETAPGKWDVADVTDAIHLANPSDPRQYKLA